MINIKIDSRKVQKGDIFVAIRGNNVDGHDYIDVAIKNGASKIVCEKDVEVETPTLVVEDTTKWLNDYIVSNYSKELDNINILGVTGTNGKTTTAYLTYQMLNLLGSKTSYIGTIGFYIPDEKIVELPNTTPNILDLYELLLTSKEKGCKNIVMEVSSHALHQKRVEGITFKEAVFTNLTQDHLDYHKTMENYLEAKMLILNSLKGSMIVNSDDDASSKWVERYINCKTLGKNGKNIKIVDFEDLLDGTLIHFEVDGNPYEIKTNLKSAFNVYNYLSAFAFTYYLGYPIEDILKITSDIVPPRGRCEIIKVKNGISVIDYAHTPDAVEKIIDAFLENKKGKIITIIGCGGDRDPIKRPIMGKIATEKSDFVVFTEDNPRTEDPKKIMDDILKGVSKDNYIVEFDRRKAIVKALDMISDNDVVLILGKGHEDYQILGREKVHLDDKEEVLKYINEKIS